MSKSSESSIKLQKMTAYGPGIYSIGISYSDGNNNENWASLVMPGEDLKQVLKGFIEQIESDSNQQS